MDLLGHNAELFIGKSLESIPVSHWSLDGNKVLLEILYLVLRWFVFNLSPMNSSR